MLKSINPTNLQVLKSYNELQRNEVTIILTKVASQFENWQLKPIADRCILFQKLGKLLIDKKQELSQIATLEMGKPISQSIAEVEKCAWLCEYYSTSAPELLASYTVETESEKTQISFQPIGAVLGVMPWNYPFWQVFRFAVPTMLAGNVALLKHASNVPQCAEAMHNLFLEAGFPEFAFTYLPISSSLVNHVIVNDIVQAISLTGSNQAGSIVSSTAAREIKKSVLELGGNDAFIVFNDADITRTVKAAITGRFQNNGQSCIAAKRFFIQEGIYDEFLNEFENQVRNLKLGDPLESENYIGPLAKKEFVSEIMLQINKSIEKGAQLRCGGSATGNQAQYLLPTILENVRPGMPAFDEEVFGPVAACTKFSTTEEAIELANHSQFGLGGSVWTSDLEKGVQTAQKMNTGTVSINEIVKSDPRVPFGGVKKSGFGRELGLQGIREFVNVKAIHLYS